MLRVEIVAKPWVAKAHKGHDEDTFPRRGRQRPSRTLSVLAGAKWPESLFLRKTMLNGASKPGGFFLSYKQAPLNVARVLPRLVYRLQSPAKLVEILSHLSNRGLQAICQGRLVLSLLLEYQSRQYPCEFRSAHNQNQGTGHANGAAGKGTFSSYA